jgi:thiamine-phosphate pyrophosphorylase
MPKIKWRRGLYAITDTSKFNSAELLEACTEVLIGGAVILQYRDKSGNSDKRLKEAVALRKLCHQFNAFLIIDNDVELCMQADADGVHLGPNDMSIGKARELLGPGRILGVSCHQDPEKAVNAVNETANYISVGAFHASKTRPDVDLVDISILDELQNLPVPIVAIGGINLENAEVIIQKGVEHVAVISDLWNTQFKEQQARAYTKLFSGTSTFFDRGIIA